ncbi:MAG TPA: DUF2059 domain-containing protein [Steroidobacteraceae bacterium]|nr:DUF2059 domain-containing protein [Steroidobacteraceae bacterium]
MRMLALLGCALWMGSAGASQNCNAPAAAQGGGVPARVATVTELLQITGVFARARAEVDRVVAQLRARNPRIPPQLWEKYAASVSAPEAVLALYAPIYARHLTDDDVRGVRQFYHSAAGEKLLAAMPVMQAEARTSAISWVTTLVGESDSSPHTTAVEPPVSRRAQRVQLLLRNSGTISQAQQMMNDLMDRFEAMPQGDGELTRTSWENARARLTNETDLINLWTPTYLRHLDDGEIGALLTFYQSETGRCFVGALPEVQKEAMEAAAQMGREAVKRATRDVLGPLPQWALDHPHTPAASGH